MNRIILIFFIALVGSSCTTDPKQPSSNELLSNQEKIPAILLDLKEQLESALDNQDADRRALDFLKSRNTPLTSLEGLTFVYYESGKNLASQVTLTGDFLPGTGEKILTHVKNTRLHFTTIPGIIPDGATYQYILEGVTGPRPVLDPFNPQIKYAKPIRNLIRTLESPKSTLQYFPDMKPKRVNPKRDVYVYLPPGYALNPEKRYPVLYMHDGQQLWDSRAAANGGWKMDTTADALIAQGKIEPLIIVGVENTSKRPEEYVGFGAYFQAPEGLDTSKKAEILALSQGYSDYLITVLKPFIDTNFRTLPDRENTGIAGSSFGAGISLWVGMSHSNLYSRIAAFSGGNYLYDDETRKDKNFYQPYPFLVQQVIQEKIPVKLYVDCGGKDVDAIFLPHTRNLIEALLQKGWKEGVDLMTVIDENAGHNEIQWAKRAGTMLEFLFPHR